MKLPYSDRDIQMFNNLLALIMGYADKKEDDIRRLIPNENQFNIVHTINKHYPSFSIENGIYTISKEGIDIQRIGLKQYYTKIQLDKEYDIKMKELALKELSSSEERYNKTSKKSNIAICISIFLPIFILIGGKYFDYKIANNPKNANSNSKIGTEINPVQFISDTLTPSNEKVSSKKINHISDSLKCK